MHGWGADFRPLRRRRRAEPAKDRLRARGSGDDIRAVWLDPSEQDFGQMKLLQNELGQPIGAPVPDWTPRGQPPRSPMEGRFARIEVLDPERHAAELYDANSQDAEGRIWT